MRMHGERATTVPPSIPCVARTDASLGSMVLPVGARPAVSFPTGIGRPRVAMSFPIPTGKEPPITDPGRWNRTRCMMVVARHPCIQPSTQHPCDPCDRTRWGRAIVAGADRISDLPLDASFGNASGASLPTIAVFWCCAHPVCPRGVSPTGGCQRYDDLPRHPGMAGRMPHRCHRQFHSRYVVLLIYHIDAEPAVHFLSFVKERKERRGNRECREYIWCHDLIEMSEDVGA